MRFYGIPCPFTVSELSEDRLLDAGLMDATLRLLSIETLPGNLISGGQVRKHHVLLRQQHSQGRGS